LLRVLRAGGRAERVREPGEAADAVLERLDDGLVLVAEWAGRRDPAGAVDVQLLLAREPEICCCSCARFTPGVSRAWPSWRPICCDVEPTSAILVM
jgi:hypothetical protein